MSSSAQDTPPAFLPPPDEEDLSRPGAWEEESPVAGSSSGNARMDRGKQRGTEKDSENPYAEDDQVYAGADEYPPTKEEEEESRKVEENLRQWELAERERRKAERSSAASSSPGPSALGDITRKASLLWPTSRAKQATLGGVGTHHALRTSDDAVPLDELENSPSPGVSPCPSPGPEDNPFATPATSAMSLHRLQHSSVITALTSANPFEAEETSPTTPTAPNRSSLPPPPPQPLGLPQPASPPPKPGEPNTSRPPEPVKPPEVVPSQQQPQDHEQVRWWHEWLCGCGEGPDRGGDHQAGRTNPFE